MTSIPDEIFRFAVVRPPATVPAEHLSIDYLRCPDGPPATSLLTRLRDLAAKGADRGAMVEAAAGFIRSATFVSPSATPDAAIQAADRIVRSVLELPDDATTATARSSVEAVLGTSLSTYVSSPAFAQGVARLWDSLIACFVAVDLVPELREELIRCLQAAAVLVALAREPPPGLDVVRRTARAIPIVPKELFAGSPDGQSPTVPPILPPIETYDLRSLDEVRALHDAWLEIDGFFRRPSDAAPAHAAPARALPPSSRPQVAPAPSPLPLPLGLDDSDPGPWRLDPAALQSLSPATRDLLARERLSPEFESAPAILERLEQRLRASVSALVSSNDGVRVNRVGSRLQRSLAHAAPANVQAVVAAMPELRPLLDAKPSPWTPQLPTLPAPSPTPPPAAHAVHVLGIGDLLVVEQELLGYLPGEISYVENVMKTEERARVVRVLDRTRDVLTTTTDNSQETTKDLQTTDRYELQQESQNTIQNDASLETGMTVSGSFGPVKAQVNADFSTSSSQSQSTDTATSYAQEVVDKSLQRIVERTRQQQVTAVVHETEQTDTHTFDNKAGTEHAIGIYCWLDKYYRAQVMSYGKRLMLEFIVPEPAAFYVYAQSATTVEGVTLEAPPDPGHLAPSDLTSATYEAWAVKYDATEVAPPPAQYAVVGVALDVPVDPKLDKDQVVTRVVKDLQVPTGYYAKSATCSPTWHLVDGKDPNRFFVRIGRNLFDMNDTSLRSGDLFSSGGYATPIPVAIYTQNVQAYIVNVEILCERTSELYAQWQLDTYGKIMAAYDRLKSAYDKQAAQAQATATLNARGRNPEANRTIELEELKRSCITLFTGFHFDSFDAGGRISSEGYPEINVAEAAIEGAQIQFLEQAFDWEQSTYLFYPYFWGRKKNWVDVEALDDVDPLFAAFLRSGAARVVVPVTPAYETAVLYYLQSGGVIWNGGSAPVIDDELYVSIVDELRAQKGEPRGKPWPVKVPTTLVYLQPTSDLPGAVTKPASDGT